MTMETSDDSVNSDEDVTSLGETTRREVPSGDIYLTDERYDKNLVNLLLDISDDLRSKESLIDVVTQESIDCLTSWTATVPNPTYIPPNAPKKKPAKSAEDNGGSHRPMLNAELRQNSRLKRTAELENCNSSHFRQCVEPTTYRYISNNASYRLSKLSAQNSSPSMNVRRMKSLDKYFSPQQRVIQREVQRSLRKDQELQKEVLQEKEEKETSQTFSVPESTPAEHSNLDESGGNAQNSIDAHEIILQVAETNAPEKVEATESDPVHLPPVDIPLVRRPISNKLIDNFSKRINVLDEEIRKDVKVHRRNVEDSVRSKSEPARLMSQNVYDIQNTPRESDHKPVFSKHRRHESIAENRVAQPYFSNSENSENYNIRRSQDLSPRKGPLLYKVREKGGERLKEGSNSAPTSFSDIYDRQNVTPGSEKAGAVVRHAQPRRTMSFDQNMIHKAKLHRDLRLATHSSNQHLRNEAMTKSNPPVKSIQPKLKMKTVSNNPSSKHVPNNFSSVPLGKNRDNREGEQDSYEQDLLPGVSGKRLQMSVVNHRLL